MTNRFLLSYILMISTEVSSSQVNFFKMLDEKIENVRDIISMILLKTMNAHKSFFTAGYRVGAGAGLGTREAPQAATSV
jgi:hypothetical protein